MPDSFDVIVIGAGPAGENVAGRAAAGGLSVAIVESELVGGECSYWACIPSKALLRPQAVLDAARRVPGAAGAVTANVDAQATLARRNEAVSNWDDAGQVKWLDGAGVTLLRGRGRLDGERRVTVEHDGKTVEYTADRAVVVATGSYAAAPPIDGLAEVDPWYSRQATESMEVPGRLLVIGGGVVAVEMAQAWRSLGAEEVTVLVRGDRLLEREEPFVSDELVRSFKAQGITVRFRAEARSFRRTEDGVQVSLASGSELVVDRVLVSTGRKPSTNDIGLETVGLTPGGAIVVDDQLRATEVGGDWLFAVGDVNERSLLTHMGKYQARIAADVILGKRGEAWADHRAVPGVVFTNPQVASVGARLADAQKNGIDAQEVRVAITSVAAAYLNGEEHGTAQLVIDNARNVIIGATFVGAEIGELLHAATIAVAGEVPLDRLWHAVPSFPTISELWLRLLEEAGL